jgi:hypothetical protein
MLSHEAFTLYIYLFDFLFVFIRGLFRDSGDLGRLSNNYRINQYRHIFRAHIKKQIVAQHLSTS